MTNDALATGLHSHITDGQRVANTSHTMMASVAETVARDLVTRMLDVS
jgi:hypothetical protein